MPSTQKIISNIKPMRIYSAFKIEDEALWLLKQKCTVDINTGQRPSKSELAEIVQTYDGVIIGRLEIIDEEVLQNSNLKFIALAAKGTDNVDLDEIRKKKISFFHTPDANTTSVAEHVMAIMLALAKNLLELDKSMRTKEFSKYRHSSSDIRDKTLGVIGAGRIAEEIIKRAKAFKMRPICYTPHPYKHKNLGIPFVTLKQLLNQSDFVTINIPLNEKTENLIDANKLKLMKKTAYLINTSRGKIVNERDLIVTLKRKQIRGAALDVFEKEPTVNNSLLRLSNVILTPHVAGISSDARSRIHKQIVNSILSLQTSRPETSLR